MNKTIPVIHRNKKQALPKPVKPYKHVEIPRVWYNLPSVLLSNVQSLNNKVDEVITTVKTVNPDIVAITEAWQVAPEICQIQGYEVFHHLRTKQRGGGLVLFSRVKLNPSRLNVEVPEELEVMWVKVSPAVHPRGCSNIIFCLAYHPPRSPTGPLLVDHIITTADTLKSIMPASKLVVCGDYNQLDLVDVVEHLNLHQVVDFPTHGQNTLDLILTDMSDLYLPPQSLPPIGLSPHLSVLWTPACTTSLPPVSTTRTYRPLPDSCVREFGQWLTRYQWVEVTTPDDVNTKWENYKTTIMDTFHHFFPLKSTTTHPSDLPWIIPRIKRLLQQRNRAFYSDNNRYRLL